MPPGLLIFGKEIYQSAVDLPRKAAGAYPQFPPEVSDFE